MRDSLKKLNRDADKLLAKLKAKSNSEKSEKHDNGGATTEPPPKMK